MPNKFYIDYFEPKYLKKSNKTMQRYLEEEKLRHKHHQKEYQKKHFKRLWNTIKKILNV